MVEYIKKDITTVTHGVVAHGCNTFGKQGSGVALAIRNKWPTIFEPYKQLCDTYSINEKQDLLGACQLINVGICPVPEINQLFVANLFTQINYGYDGRVYADTDAIEIALNDCMEFCSNMQLTLYLPHIGCKLGGLNWDKDVGPIVEHLATKHNVEVFVCDL